MTGMTASATIASRVAALTERIHSAATAAGRVPSEVRVLLATKTQDTDGIAQAIDAARAHELSVLVGENRVQELVAKAGYFAGLRTDIHLIGPLQSNKVNAALAALAAATHAAGRACIQTVDSASLARRLASRCQGNAPLDVMIQVNTAMDEFKRGIEPALLPNLAEEIANHPTLRLVGLMTIGPRSRDRDVTTAAFESLRTLRESLIDRGHAHARELSMGMSGDLDLAIAAGATIVRPGTAVFGSRPTV
ncbi:YggS family pyridoxal phosphate-dependent enzyme [Rarobacter faecitabidus]|uniref:Pyridoxal phosphate homeostasis protein n=1 Tax=Rarobacter faecitabidus TaxID=13243 RepID=A0A542ZX71_RARFA|nr:YggS family pyridoxal phosphate-dependent enzyme [Rarobacter faecitabidus]TQL64836.1 hypothetical protein FB461_1359 [Rarobacter faecitabidus]